MMPSEHMFYGFFASLLVLFFFPSIGTFGFLIVFLSSFLIDTDHYLAYVYLKKDFSLSKSVEFYLAMGNEQKKLRTKKTEPLMIFHTAEFWGLLLILSFFSSSPSNSSSFFLASRSSCFRLSLIFFSSFP